MKRNSSDIEKKNFTLKYTFDEKEICEVAFLQVHALGMKRWKNIRSHYQNNGIKPIIHGNKGRKGYHALTFETILNVLKFIINFANIHGLPSPGRNFCDNTLAITFLLANESYAGLYRLYDLTTDLEHSISRWSFLRIWKKYVFEIKFLSSRSDLCTLCKIMRFNSQLWHINERDSKVLEWNKHILWANEERNYYKKCITDTKNQLLQFNLSELKRSGNPNSLEIENHISWDFAEAVNLSHSSQQEGSIFFKSPWKIFIFGICKEAFPQQKVKMLEKEQMP
ncbi:unnamed protein product [Rhizophagus irregularis]|nr:unnamed protein product [Rhizophagus irregularis]